MNTTSEETTKGEEEQENLWEKLLSQHAQQDTQDQSKNLIILGSASSGKTALLNRFLHQDFFQEKVASGLGLEYSYLEVDASPDQDFDFKEKSTTVLNCWIVDSDEKNLPLTKFAIPKLQILQDACLLIVLDMSKPWTVIEELEVWLNIFRKHTATLITDNLEKWEELKEKNKTRYKSSMSKPDEKMEEGVLKNNLGLPIIVVGNKCDVFHTLEKDYGYKEAHFDYIATSLRRVCLNYGASLIYCSSKKNANCEVLLDYITHILYGFKLKSNPCLERDDFFVPSGSDSFSKTETDLENVRRKLSQNLDNYGDVIPIPPKLQSEQITSIDPVIVFEDDQEFFQRHYLMSEGHEKSSSILETLRKKGDTPLKSEAESTPKKTTSHEERQVLAELFNSLVQTDSPKREPHTNN